jgi:hypothetical protein
VNLIYKWLGGFCLVGNTYAHSRAYLSDQSGFLADAKNLSGDIQMLGADLRASLHKVEPLYGQTYPSQSSKSKWKQSSAYPA